MAAVHFPGWGLIYSFRNFTKFQQNAFIRKTEKARQKIFSSFQKQLIKQT